MGLDNSLYASNYSWKDEANMCVYEHSDVLSPLLIQGNFVLK